MPPAARLPALPNPAVTEAKRCCNRSLHKTTPTNTSNVADRSRTTSPSSPIAAPMVATNRPSAVNETVSPAASATTPQRCTEAAAPSTSGSNGSTHGDSTDSTPARPPRPIEAASMLPNRRSGRRPGSQSGRQSGRQSGHRLVEQCADRRRIGSTDRARRLLLAVERDQGALLLRTHRADDVLLGIEIHHEHRQCLERRISLELAEDRPLLGADRTP